MNVIIDEAALSMYANRAEQYLLLVAGCAERYAAAVRSILGEGRGLFDTDITAGLLEAAEAMESLPAALAGLGEKLAAELRAEISETAAADCFAWQDGGFGQAAAAFSAC